MKLEFIVNSLGNALNFIKDIMKKKNQKSNKNVDSGYYLEKNQKKSQILYISNRFNAKRKTKRRKLKKQLNNLSLYVQLSLIWQKIRRMRIMKCWNI